MLPGLRAGLLGVEKVAAALTAGFLTASHTLLRAAGLLPKGVCRFEPTCSTYAKQALQQRRLPMALCLIVLRAARCQPFCRGGKDPVPVARGRN